MPKKKNRRGTFLPAPPRNPPANLPQQVAISSRSAPLPHPSELEEYERILPGSAERIFAMAESQSNHRQGLEKKALSMEGIRSLLGIISGLLIGVIGLSIAGLCIYTGHDTAGATLGGTTLGSLVWTFVYGTRQRRIEREQKYQVATHSRR